MREETRKYLLNHVRLKPSPRHPKELFGASSAHALRSGISLALPQLTILQKANELAAVVDDGD